MTALVLDLIRAFDLGNGIIGRDDVVLEILVGNQTAGVYDGDGNGRLPPSGLARLNAPSSIQIERFEIPLLTGTGIVDSDAGHAQIDSRLHGNGRLRGDLRDGSRRDLLRRNRTLIAFGKIVDEIGLRAQPPVLEGAQDPGHGDRGIDLDLDKTGGDVLAGDILCPRDFQTLEHGIDAVQVRRLVDVHEHLARLEISVLRIT